MNIFTRKASIASSRVQGFFRPETVDLENRTIEVVFTTGQAGKRYDWYNDVEYIEELEVTPQAIRKERLDKGLSVIDNHDTYRGIDGVFGITEDYRIEDGQLIGTVRFATDPDSEIKFTKAADGILRHVSLGYKVNKFLKFRGGEDKLDTYRAIDWEPNELSFTPVSFENNNGVRAEQRNLNDVEIEEFIMTPEQKARMLALQGSATRTAAEQEEYIKLLQLQNRSMESVVTPAAPAAAVAPIIEEVIPAPAAARTQEVIPAPAAIPAPVIAPAAPVVDAAAIRTAERANLGLMTAASRSVDLPDSFALTHYEAGTNIDNFRTLVIEELANQSNNQIVSTNGVPLTSDNRSDNQENVRNDAQSSLHYRLGENIELTDGIRTFQAMTLFDMGRDFVEASGVNTRGMSRQAIAMRAFHTTSDFPLILENVMNKNLQTAYQETPQTFRDLGRRTTFNDFREKHTYSMGDAPNLLPLGEHGEYKAGTFSEGKEKYSIATYARKIAFSRKMLINDDMSALGMMPTAFGQAGSRLESDIVWGLLLGYDFNKGQAVVHLMNDGNPLFDATHGNHLDGAGGAFSVDSISALRMLGRKAKTLDNNFMNITYGNLVIPEDIETTVEKILVQNFTAITSETTNPFQNKLQFRVEPRLSQVSTTAWYAFAKEYQVFEYAYLAGEQEMMTEVVTQTDVDGLEIKVRKDFGAGYVDYRGAAKSDGLPV